MLRLSLLLSVFLLGQITLFSQSITHNGRVLDAENSSPLPGAVVQDELSGLAVTTDADGYFSIQVGAYPITLKYRSLGFITLKSEHQGNNSVVSLEADQILLSEAVITALGLERDSKDLGYSVQKLESKEVTEVKSVNFVDDLAGKIAGVTINQGATGVGSTSRISIRGENSFTNNNPLFIVDGIPINNNSVINNTNEAAAGFQEVDFGNGAMEINADDIEQISVLKGPSAAALYGTRASNGVILITTKKGQANDGIGVTFNSTSSIERAFKLPDFQNKYGQGNSGQFEFVDGLEEGINDNISYSWGPALDQGLLIPQFDSPVTLPDGTIVRGGDVAVHGGLPISATPFVSNPDNLKNFYQTGSTLINNIAITAGGAKSSMRLSYTDLRSESIIPGVNLDRQNINANLEFKPIDKLVVRSSINYVHSASDNRPSSGYGSENVNYSLVAWGPRSLNIANLEDYWQPGLEDLQQYSFNYTFFDNPYFILHENRNSFDRDRVFGNVSASYEINVNLKVILRTGMDNSSELREFRRAFSSNRFRNGAFAEHDVRFREQNTDLLVDYNKKFGNINLGVSLGGNRMEQTSSTRQIQALNLAQPGIFSLNNAASPLEAFEFVGRKRINSIYALAKLSYKDFLFVDVTARNDWSSALATPTSTANTSFFYPSVSSALILDRIIDLPEVISFAKVRASWAQVGNDTNPYQTSATFASQTPVNGLPTFSADDLIPNPDLLPEKTSSVEVGLDMRFFNDRLQFDVTYYNNLTENQITALPVPISSGYTG
ncbi:MAG: SusC/RagA family TonB-linked outer membrane protein, partial [Flavobacteriales bacterium]